jgi:hypothetical protein
LKKRLVVLRDTPDDRLVPLLPDEHGGGVVFSLEEMIAQARRYAELYLGLIARLVPSLAIALDVPETSARVLARNGIVPLAHAFLDRLLRAERLARNVPDLCVPAPKRMATPTRCEELFTLASTSPAFNQDILARCGRLIGLDSEAPDKPVPYFVDRGKLPSKFVNHLFDFDGLTLPVRAKYRLVSKLSRLTGSVIATWTVNNRVPMLRAGLFGVHRFAHLQDDWGLNGARPNFHERQAALGSPLLDSAADLQGFLRSCGFGRAVDGRALGEAFAQLCCDYFPTSLFEAARANMNKATEKLSRYRRCRTVFSSGISLTTQSAFLIAAARKLGLKVVGGQHGGHFGYIEPHVLAWENEYPDCDEFATWGWSPMPEHPALHRVKAVPLPSPWLCERTTRWRRLLAKDQVPVEGKFDLVFMPNKVYPIIPAPSGAHATREHLPAVAKMIRDVVVAFARAGYKVLVKPYSSELEVQMPDTIRAIREECGTSFTMSDNLDKGLTLDLVQRCRMVLWDQPGTGFIECAAAAIPNMVLWPHTYHCPTNAAQPIFAELEEAGVVHRKADSMLNEFRRYMADPAGWMADVGRQAAIQRFLQTYAWIKSDWKVGWIRFIEERS